MNLSRWFPRLLMAGIWLAGFAPAYTPPQSASAVYTVTTTDDTMDGVCDSHCSLREAIQAANAHSGVDTIEFGLPGSHTYKITRAGANEINNLTGDFNIKEGLNISGNGRANTIIDAASLDRAFYIHAGAAVTFNGLTISGGLPPANDNLGGGGILNRGTLSLIDVVISGNQGIQGAGISNSLSYMKIINSLIQDNGDFSTREGGGIYSDGPLNIDNTTILNNKAGRGGGVSGSDSADMYFTGVTFSDNEALGEGGAIYNDKQITLLESTVNNNLAEFGAGIYSNYALRLSSVTVNGNQAGTSGGGIYNEGAAELINVTLSANAAGGDPQDYEGGGGIFNTSSLRLTHTTFYGNNASAGASLYNYNGRVHIANTIFARNGVDPNCLNRGVQSQIISLGRNLEDVNSCALSWPGDIKNQNPKLDVLIKDGRSTTATHALLPGSPAIDTGRAEYCAQADQRGVFRPVDGDENGVLACDIGTYELVTAGWISFNKPEYTEADGVYEGYGPVDVDVIVTLERITGKDQPISVDYTYNTPPVYDFVPFSGKLTWEAGDSAAKSFTITILNDEYKEPEKIIEGILKNATAGAGISPNGIVRLIVPANDPFGQDPPPPIYLPLIIRP